MMESSDRVNICGAIKSFSTYINSGPILKEDYLLMNFSFKCLNMRARRRVRMEKLKKLFCRAMFTDKLFLPCYRRQAELRRTR